MIAKHLLAKRFLLQSSFHTSKRLIAAIKPTNDTDSVRNPEPAQSDGKITPEFILNKLNRTKPPATESVTEKARTIQETSNGDEEFDGFTKQSPLPTIRDQRDRALLRLESKEGSSLKTLSPEKKRKIIEYNWVMNRESGHNLPEEIDEKSMQLLMSTESYSHLKQTFDYLVKKHYYNKERQLKRQEYERRKEEIQKRVDNGEAFRTNYPGHDSFVRHSTNAEKQFNRNKLLSAYLNKNPSVVFDFHFEHIFDSRDELVKSLYRQMIEVISRNTKAKEPLNIHFCNYNFDRQFNQRYKNFLALDENLIFETPKSYLDVFPKEQLVYLTRDSKRVMRAFDPNKVYIIGALVDTKTDAGRRASYAQAKKDGIASESLPLDNFVDWATGSKTLNINTVFEILLNLYNGMDWAGSIEEAVPSRKLAKKGITPGFKKYYKD